MFTFRLCELSCNLISPALRHVHVPAVSCDSNLLPDSRSQRYMSHSPVTSRYLLVTIICETFPDRIN